MVVASALLAKVALVANAQAACFSSFAQLNAYFATLFFFTAIKTNPIPNALTLLFVSPLIVAMLAPFVLGERFDIFIGIGVLVGFVGVVIV